MSFDPVKPRNALCALCVAISLSAPQSASASHGVSGLRVVGPEPSSQSAGVDGASELTPIIHAIDTRPDEDRGFVWLARYIDRTSQSSGQTTIITTRYEDVCKLPCGGPIDISERPIFFFVRDGSPISGGFRIPGGADEFTLKVRPARKGMLVGGWTMIASIVLFPFGIPLAIAGKSRVSIAPGSPAAGQDFVRLRGAKT